ncbi:amidohydrolase [Aquirufa aurantiipilula]|uniref:Amidohydrolase n=1 Tax=Aquirufa aurantiipilula TaxID=2696561 RepID=A0ABT6BHW4_9BACT|nr:amidohydrolase [Aquirufa aurantiipilula]MDF5690050.1 amidohydrolase [Aquirufa aurantiipilula]
MKAILNLALYIISFSLLAQEADKKKVIQRLQQKESQYGQMANQIWRFAEVGYKEKQSSLLLQETLRKAGFTIESGVAEIPTAFVATFGQGKPVIGIMGEYDALPGMSQDSIPTKRSLGHPAGHACGHHLFGTGSAAAAIAVKEWMQETGQKGTIKFYGCPAEEGGSGKVYMVRAGLFSQADVMLHWHPNNQHVISMSNSLANKAGKFRFYGLSSHAAASPERGRSALDAVEAMNYMANMMREHIPSTTRMHYVITNGGKAPNIVPDFAEVYYYVRSPKRDIVMDVWDRLENAAKGAALGTGTKYEAEVIGGVYEMLPNDRLARVMHANLQQVGGYILSPSELAFAKQIQQSEGMEMVDLASTNQIKGLNDGDNLATGSTDVADVSWTVPTIGLGTAAWVPGTSAHSWQAVAAGGMSIGRKGMMVAAKTLASTAIDLFKHPELVKEAKAEFDQRRGPNFVYKSLLGIRQPALNYRD